MSPLVSASIKSNSIKDVFNCYANQPDSFGAFDIDNTMIETLGIYSEDKQYAKLGGDAWFGFFLAESQRQYGKQIGLDSAVALYAVLQTKAQHRVVEVELVNHFSRCRDQLKTPMIGLTARGPEVRDITQTTLTKFRLQFTSDSGSQSGTDPYIFLVEEKEVQFSHGVLFCAGRDKGKVLAAFLETEKGKALYQGCQSVFFVDDKQKNCASVLKAMSDVGRDCRAVHYTYMNHTKNQYTQKDANLHQLFVKGLQEQLSDLSMAGEAASCSR